jgi:hypothetical protein
MSAMKGKSASAAAGAPLQQAPADEEGHDEETLKCGRRLV